MFEIYIYFFGSTLISYDLTFIPVVLFSRSNHPNNINHEAAHDIMPLVVIHLRNDFANHLHTKDQLSYDGFK